MHRSAVWTVVVTLALCLGACSTGGHNGYLCNDAAPCTGGHGGAAGGVSAGGAAGQGTGGTTSLPPLHKLDLLFVIDNSVSMADKQTILGDAVPGLLQRLVNPDCVPQSGSGASVPSPSPDAPCASGYVKEFQPVTDIHVGIVTSSLGGHGGHICSPAWPGYTPAQDDKGHLLGSIRTGLNSYNSLGFLNWDPRGLSTPAGQSDEHAFVTDFRAMVNAVGENGCGYEATLESFYRFLVDPEPPDSVTVSGNVAVLSGTDAVILAQRKAFLRSDSVVAVTILTDENDCSVADGPNSWLVATDSTGTGAFTMPRATTACATDPNSACCRSCAVNEATPPTGCTALTQDPACLDTSQRTDDSLNLRCFQQRRRFGIDYLYPVQRYIDGLKATLITNREGATVRNPLYSDLTTGAHSQRQPGHVFAIAIVGVPWQDVVTDNTLTGPTPQFVTAADLQTMDRWKVILGDPDRGVLPTDPLMIESTGPRTGTNPVIHAALAPATSTNPQANPINGHEYQQVVPSDLQYACIFPLSTPKDCSTATSCDCRTALVPDNRPLCNPPAGGPAGTTQYYAKAYPGLRHLALMRALGGNAVVASICPKALGADTASPSFGYNPAMDALLARLRRVLTSG